MTQNDIALLSGIDAATYGRIERGIGNPRLATVLRLATTLELEPGTLLNGLAVAELLPTTTRTFTVAEFVKARRRSE